VFLDEQALRGLTRCKQPTKMIAWLRDNKYPHDVGDDGYPVVLESYVQTRLGGKQRTRGRAEPNVAALNIVMRKPE